MSNQMRIEIPNNIRTTPKKNKKQSFISVAEEAFLLRKFGEALSLCYQALSKIAENTTRAFYYYDQKTPVATEKDEPFQSEKSSKYHPIIQKLNSLYHECSNPTTCGCIPYMAIVIQSMFEIQKETNERDPLIDDIVTFLLQFYGTIHKIPFQILLLCVNGLINTKNYAEAFSLLTYCLTKKTETNAKRKFSEEEYENLCQLYLFHVLPKLEKWSEAESFLQNDYELSQWKKEAFLRHVHLLKSQAEIASLQPTVENPVAASITEESPKADVKDEVAAANVVASKASILTVIKNLKIWNVVFGVSFLFSLFALTVLYLKSKKRAQLQQPPQNNNTKTKANTPAKTARKIQTGSKESSVGSLFSIFKSFSNPYGRYT